MANERIFYAAQQVGIAPDGSTSFEEVHGAQSVGITTTFSLEQVFELGQIEIYDSIENIPDVEITCEKALDGHPPIYLLATSTATSPTLAGRSTARPQVAISIFPDDQDSTGVGTNPLSQVTASGMYPQNMSWNIPVDGTMTESMTFVGNHKAWVTNGAAGMTFLGSFNNADVPLAAGSGGVQTRQNLLFGTDGSYASNDVNGCVIVPSGSVFPTQIFGVSTSGTNDLDRADRARLQNISVSVDLGREPIFELGRRLPYVRYATFPVEVTSSFEVVSSSGDMITVTEDGVYGGGGGCNSGSNLVDQTIKIATCEGTRLNLRYKNKLTSVTQSGGDASGGNVSVSYNFSNFNALTVTHANDPNATHAGNWLNWYMFDQAASL